MSSILESSTMGLSISRPSCCGFRGNSAFSSLEAESFALKYISHRAKKLFEHIYPPPVINQPF